MKFRTIVITAAFAMSFSIVVAQTKERESIAIEIPKMVQGPIAKIFHAEGELLKHGIYKSDIGERLEMALDLVAKSKAQLSGRSVNFHEPDDIALSFTASWRLVILLWRSSSDTSVKGRVLEEWDNSLRDIPECSLQIESLMYSWDRAFISKGFWDLLANGHNTQVLASIGRILNEHGNSEDLKQLEKRINQEKNKNIRWNLSCYLCWANYRLHPEKYTEPACVPIPNPD